MAWKEDLVWRPIVEVQHTDGEPVFSSALAPTISEAKAH